MYLIHVFSQSFDCIGKRPKSPSNADQAKEYGDPARDDSGDNAPVYSGKHGISLGEAEVAGDRGIGEWSIAAQELRVVGVIRPDRAKHRVVRHQPRRRR